jgi:transposase
MGKKADLSLQKKQAIRTLLLTGLSYRSVVEATKRQYNFDVSKSSVERIAKEPNLVGSGNRTGKCGRRKKLSKRDVRHLRRLAKENRKLPSRKLADLFRHVTGHNVSHSCVLYTLYESGMRRMKPKRKPLLSLKNKGDRLNFANAHLHWNEEWRNVIFSDEKKFNVYGNDGGLRVWADECELGGEVCQQPTVKFSESVMIWACFSWRGMGRLYVVPSKQTLNAEHYIQLLQKCLLPTIREQFPTDKATCIFQQDNASCHKAKLVSNWFRQNQVNVMTWPAQSADLNPIENLWAIIVAKLRYEQYSDRTSLIVAIVKVWNHMISTETRVHLVDSMPNRMQDVVHSKGGSIDY